MNAEELIRRMACFALISIMLNLSFVPAFGEDLPSSSLETPPAPPELVDSPKSAEFKCSTPDSEPERNVLQPEEVQKLKQVTEIENKGFVIDNINSGRGQNTERDELENNIVVQTQNDGSANVNELPDSKMDTGEISQWFNTWFPGPFAFGVSLDDTIRIGQCRNLEGLEASGRGCPVEDKQLSYRNSGSGITQNVKTVWEDVKDIFSGESTGQYTEAQVENLQVQIAGETDLNSLEAKSVQREVKLIPNSVKTEDFTARMATSGDSSSSLISVYSMFDKYFNSWFSTEMVVTTFGPTLWGQARKYASWAINRGWPWNMADNKFVSAFRRKYWDPESLMGEARLKRMVTRTDKYGFGDAWTKGIEQTEWDGGYSFMKGAGWRKNVNEWTKSGGYLDEMTDPVVRGEFFKQIKDLRGFAHTNNAIYKYYDDIYKTAIKKFGAASPEAKAALLDLGRENARLMLAADGDWLRLDATELWAKEEVTGLYSKGIKVKDSGHVIPVTNDSKPLAKVQDAFAKKGTFGDAPFATTPEGFLEIYKVSPTGEYIGEVTIDDLRKNLSRYIDKAALTEKGDFMKIDSSSLNYIAKESAGTGNVKIYKADWVLDHVETPEMYAQRLTNLRADRLANTMPKNVDRLYRALVERNFAGQSRRYYSALDKAFAQEQEILKSYFSVKGGIKWTVMPFLYWEGKRGFGFEALSAFQLPDSWKTVEIYTEEEPIYDDAFIDILAQHGSDEGEIFVQVLNKLPWKMALDYVSETFSPVSESYKKMTSPLSGWRREVENVAYFTSTRNDCATCQVVLMPRVDSEAALKELKDKGRGEAVISFNAEQDMTSYFLEDVIDAKAKEEGTTLIAFGHHTNIKGESIGGDAVTPPIDLVEAQKEKTTCADAVKELGLGFLGDNPQRVGGVLAFTETLGYVIFLWSGILGSVIQQTLLVPKLQDCVDDVDGYFLHMYAAYDKSKEGVETANEKGSKSAGNIFKSFTDTVLGKKAVEEDEDKVKPPVDSEGQAYTSAERGAVEDKVVYDRTGAAEAPKNFWESVKQEIADQAETLSQKAQSKELLQLEVETMGVTDGLTLFKKIFFFWFKGLTQQAVYDAQSKSVLEDNDKDLSLIVDKESGKISAKKGDEPAEDIITSEDHVRLSGPDGRVPAEVIPQRIGRIELPSGPVVELFELDSQGSFKVLEPSVLECIKRNVEAQTGVPLNTNNITDAFGAARAIVTDIYPTISVNAKDKTITANGMPREIVYGSSARVIVMSDMNTTMLNGRTVPAGKFQSVQFSNGVILFKPASASGPAELIVWLRYNEKSVLRRSDVSGLKATVAEVINPETGCPEPAINLEALPNLEAGENSAVTERVENFNKSIAKMGPFQVFDTEKHRFVFYSEKTSPDCSPQAEGCCQDRVSIINKETGEVYDQPIVGGIEQTPTGIKFKTADGQEHTLDFSADNGVPKISYNDQPPETLTMARGPNGAFWYDPEDELWRPYNAQLLPLHEDFKTMGFDTRHREDCTSSTQPGSNTMNVQIGGSADTPWVLPSVPTEPMAMLLFLLSLVSAIYVARLRIERKFSV